jgi:hypothetical protein
MGRAIRLLEQEPREQRGRRLVEPLREQVIHLFAKVRGVIQTGELERLQGYFRSVASYFAGKKLRAAA